MSDNDVIKALECCLNDNTCKNCPANIGDDFGYDCALNNQDILDCINRLETEIKKLKAEQYKLKLKMSYMVKASPNENDTETKWKFGNYI